MSVSREEVRRIAELAELRVEDDAVDALAEQLSRILDYVAQLERMPAGDAARPFVAGPEEIALRPDEVRPWPLADGPADLARGFREGFFTVPRLGQFEGGADDGDEE